MRSDKYKLMIYFAITTLFMYEKSIISGARMTPLEFKESNKDVIKRVFDEGVSLFNYELSDNQMGTAVAGYLATKYNPSSIDNTEPYKWTDD